jgi:hypothetical protein
VLVRHQRSGKNLACLEEQPRRSAKGILRVNYIRDNGRRRWIVDLGHVRCEGRKLIGCRPGRKTCQCCDARRKREIYSGAIRRIIEDRLICRRKFECYASCGQSQQNEFRQHLRVLTTMLYLMTYLDKQTTDVERCNCQIEERGVSQQGGRILYRQPAFLRYIPSCRVADMK